MITQFSNCYTALFIAVVRFFIAFKKCINVQIFLIINYTLNTNTSKKLSNKETNDGDDDIINKGGNLTVPE